MKNRKAFTLAEVLITLVIIGVIAAMTIPSLLNNTNKQETITSLKKSYSVLSQALLQHYALTGESYEEAQDNCENDVDCIYEEFFAKRMNVVSSTLSPVAYSGGGDLTFYTADGMAYSFDKYTSEIFVDLNGDKGPNTRTSYRLNGNADIKDGYRFIVKDKQDSNWNKIGEYVYPACPTNFVLDGLKCLDSEYGCTCPM
ncbi:MAG: type II secretion system protein [Candidatus Gastranaerophilales bacterium]|nr:type II secretion system protein [Candidatus Gastranaerophilales bacterium]